MATAGQTREQGKADKPAPEAAEYAPPTADVDLYQKLRAEILSRHLQSALTYDKYLFSLSTGALAVSIGFIKDVVPLYSAEHTGVLIGSWVCFCSAIVATLLSYLTSQHAQVVQLKYAEELYLRGKTEYEKKPNYWDQAGTWLTHFSAVTFISAVILTVMFVSLNVL